MKAEGKEIKLKVGLFYRPENIVKSKAGLYILKKPSMQICKIIFLLFSAYMYAQSAIQISGKFYILSFSTVQIWF